MKILSIGNSFSHDAHRWLHQLAKANGVDMQTVNLYIGGCSLEAHWTNVIENNSYYDLEVNGKEGERKISITDALNMDKWDIITLQQVSQHSGMPQTYLPYLLNLAEYVRKAQPQAQVYWHQTWAYETDSGHSGFVYYNNDQREMYRRIFDASQMACKLINAPILPSGAVIQKLRETLPEFDYKNGGRSLNRDGFHLTLDYGRFAAAATWLHTITGRKVDVEEFEDFDSCLLKRILAVVNQLSFPGNTQEA